MSDYINIHPYNSEKNLYNSVRNLFAFLPKEGYIIFEGYIHIKKEDLPYRVKIHRSNKDIDFYGYFEADIIETYKKDLQTLPSPKNHECESDECECNISFFPSDIIILKISITKPFINKEYPSIDWSYCIDNRFATNDELIEKYKNLLELPEDNFKSYTSREEDWDFYKGLHDVMSIGIDMYSSQYENAIKMKQYLGRVNGARKMPRIPSKDVLPVIGKWCTLYRNANKGISTDFGNKQFLRNCITLFNYIEEQSPFLLKWCAEYLCELPFQDKLRGWLTYGIKIGVDDKNLSDYEKYWKLFFRLKDDTPDIICLGDTEFDISYRHYLKLIKQRKEEKKKENCNIDEINNIHKDLGCTDWLACDLCEEIEMTWKMIVSNKYKSMNNIFINRDLGKVFIENWLEATMNLKDTEKEHINFTWPPPRKYYVMRVLNRFGQKNNNYEYDEFISELIKERDQIYYSYYKRPKVEFEFINDLRTFLGQYSMSNIYPFKESTNQFNEIYLTLSSILSVVPYVLYMDKKRCNELMDIFDKLIDE